MSRILVLSDLHLRAGPAGAVRGVRTRAGLEATLAEAQRAGPYERIVLCGDLAQEPRTETYAALRDLLPAGTPLLLLAGNHDLLPPLRAVFPQRPETPHYGFVDAIGGWRLIGLDSHWPGRVRGRLGPSQVAWLEGVLSEDERPAILFVHHPPVRVATWWLDGSRLDDALALEGVLARTRRVRLVIHGHVHMASDGILAGVRVVGTPSTAFQFVQGTLLPRRGSAVPGYRTLDLGDGSFETEVLYSSGDPATWYPGSKAPRSCKRRFCAGSQVILRIASASGITFSARTYFASTRAKAA